MVPSYSQSEEVMERFIRRKRSVIQQLKVLKKKPEKIRFNGIQTNDLCDAGKTLYY